MTSPILTDAYQRAFDEAFAAEKARQLKLESPSIRVKPLIWTDNEIGGSRATAGTNLGCQFTIVDSTRRLKAKSPHFHLLSNLHMEGPEGFGSLAAAKQAAEIEWTQFILSTIQQ